MAADEVVNVRMMRVEAGDDGFQAVPAVLVRVLSAPQFVSGIVVLALGVRLPKFQIGADDRFAGGRQNAAAQNKARSFDVRFQKGGSSRRSPFVFGNVVPARCRFVPWA